MNNMAEQQKKTIKVGSRKSQLALIQTNSVIKMLKDLQPHLEFEVVTMSTTGDKILDTALSKIGEKSLFTKELEVALEDHRVDFVVHSLKDLPTVLPEGMAIGAVCKRDDPRDAVVMHPKHQDKKSLNMLPEGSVIGTSSLRRAAQFKRNFPHLKIKDVRGNLNTRFRKLDESDDYDALVLAAAGLDRMGWQDRISHILEPSECMYAVSQGAMAVECRATDTDTLQLLSSLHHFETLVGIVAERAFLKKLEGGCSVPVAVHSEVSDDKLTIKGGVFSIDGTKGVMQTLEETLPGAEESAAKKRAVGDDHPSASASPRQYSCIIAQDFPQNALQVAEVLGVDLAEKMIASGAGDILKAAKQETVADIMKQKEAKEAKLKAAQKENNSAANVAAS